MFGARGASRRSRPSGGSANDTFPLAMRIRNENYALRLHIAKEHVFREF